MKSHLVIIPVIIAAVLLVPMVAFGQNTTQSGQKNSPSSLSNGDHEFLHTIAQECQSEIELANMALQKSSDAQVKGYAHQILSDDPTMEAQAKTLAKSYNKPIDATPSSAQKQEHDKLAKLSGHQFDEEYMAYEAGRQQKDLELVQQETKSTQDNTVRAYTTTGEPHVADAADSAKKIYSDMQQQTAAKK